MLLLLVASCTSSRRAAPPTQPQPQPVVRARPVVAGLTAYGSCARLRQSVRREAVAEMTPYGLEGGLRLGARGGPPVAAPVPAFAARTADTGAATPVKGVSGTDVQEAGVDELDAVKSDGRVLLVVTQQPLALQVLDVTGARPRVAGRLLLPPSLQSPQALLLGDRAVVVGTEYGSALTTTARVVGLTDPAKPVLERTFTVDGAVVDARAVGGRVLLAVQDAPQIPTSYPLDDSKARVDEALGRNRHAAATATASAVLPTVRSSDGATVTPDCAHALHPDKPSGLGTTTLVTLDPARSAPTQTLTVVGGTSEVYVSTTALYLTTQEWGTSLDTQVHGFDTTDPDAPVQLGSATVPGTLLDRYAMSATADELRLATTAGSDSRVTVLRPRGGRLVQVGVVTGLGKGERVYGVRFVDDLAYVVTFRETDPLYVVDLADGAHPRVRGQLELTGYSSALYPLDDGRLLGVGQAADLTGRTQGAQVSVFDVTDPAAPRLAGRHVEPGWSAAQDDHHALLWWPAAHLVVLPVQRDAAAPVMVALRVDAAGRLTEAGRWSGRGTAPLTRSGVMGDLLYSVSDSGVDVAPLERLSEHTWIPFS